MANAGKADCQILFELFSTPRGKVSIGRADTGEHAGRIVLLRELEASLVPVVEEASEWTRRFTHPQLLKLLGILSDGERSYLASEHLPAVSLFELLARVRARQTPLELGAAVQLAMETLRLIDRAGSLLREAGRPRVRLFYSDCVWIADYGETLLAEAGVSAHLGSGRSASLVEQGTQAIHRDAMTLSVELVQLATARLVTGDLARAIREHLPAPLADALEDTLVSLSDGAADPIAIFSKALRALPPSLRGSETMLASEVGRIARDLLEARRSKLADLQISANSDSADVTRIYSTGMVHGQDADEVTAMVQGAFRGLPVAIEPVASPPSSSPIPLSLATKERKRTAKTKRATRGTSGARARASRFSRGFLVICAGAVLVAISYRHPEWSRALAQRLEALFQ